MLMANQLPTRQDALAVEEEWKKRSQVPDYVFSVLNSLPARTHPMTMFSHAILAMQNESVFAAKYREGLKKPVYWRATLEDSLNLTAKLPAIAAYIYNHKFQDGLSIEPDPNLDWSANFAHMIGKPNDKDYFDLSRLYFVLHCDHEGANVSAHVSALVNSALSDVYYASSAAINGLAGPLHGVANQECVGWLLTMREHFTDFPTAEQVKAYAWDVLKRARSFPGTGMPSYASPTRAFLPCSTLARSTSPRMSSCAW